MKGKVLFLDNDTGVLEAFRALFEHTGLEVFTTSFVDDFHLLIAKHDPDVILIDVNMAGIRGDEVVAAVRNGSSSARVILFSGISPLQLKELSRRSGANGFLSKMDEPNDILVAVLAQIEVRRRLRDRG